MKAIWNGQEDYYSMHVRGQYNEDAAWYYPEPYAAAKAIKGRVAFWKGIRVAK